MNDETEWLFYGCCCVSDGCACAIVSDVVNTFVGIDEASEGCYKLEVAGYRLRSMQMLRLFLS